MKVLDIYDIKTMNYDDKEGLMEYESSGVIKSKKYFPDYGCQIFKPLSKTKPLTTPLFAYSEVFWSYYIQKYFERNAPRYFLAKCNGIEQEIKKDYSIGTLVFKVTKENEKLINLLEYFKTNPDSNVNIINYINYCGKIYDYSKILKATIFEKREDLRHQLENQILLSILKRDENFHYENVSFIVKENQIISLCPTLDSEFSLMFLYPDQEKTKKAQISRYNRSLNIPFEKQTTELTVGEWKEEENLSWKTSLDNIIAIIKRDSDVIISFLEKLNLFIQDLEETDILFYNDGFFEKLSSDAWEIGYARYKNQNEKEAFEIEKTIVYQPLNDKEFNENLKSECLESAKNLKFVLQVLLSLHNHQSLDNITIQHYLKIIGHEMTKQEFTNLTIDEKLKIANETKIKYLTRN